MLNEADDEKFGKVMTERQAIGRNATFAHTTPQSHKRSVVVDSEEGGDNDSFSESAIDNDHSLPSQPMPPPLVPSEISSPLTDISKANTSSLPELKSATTDQPGSSR